MILDCEEKIVVWFLDSRNMKPVTAEIHLRICGVILNTKHIEIQCMSV